MHTWSICGLSLRGRHQVPSSFSLKQGISLACSLTQLPPASLWLGLQGYLGSGDLSSSPHPCDSHALLTGPFSPNLHLNFKNKVNINIRFFLSKIVAATIKKVNDQDFFYLFFYKISLQLNLPLNLRHIVLDTL